MIIEIKDGIVFDTEKSFDEQTFACQNYFYKIMNDEQPNVEYDEFQRPVVEFWRIHGTSYHLEIQRISVYQKQEPDWHLQSQTIKIVEL